MKIRSEQVRNFICLTGLLMMVLGLNGCQTSGSKDSSEQGQGQDIERSIAGGKEQGEDVRLMKGEMRQVRQTAAELMQKFSSDDPREWKETAKKIERLGTDMLPDILKNKIKKARERGPEGERARKQLVKWGRLKSIVLTLPSRDPKQWDQVRKQMLEQGGAGKEMFLLHMIDFLKKPDRNRQRAAKQLAKCGRTIVNEAWGRMERLATEARNASAQGKSIAGAMIILQGLAQVQVHAGRWKRIRSALQHNSIRIRMAMTQALRHADQVSRITTLLEHVVRQDPSFRVRNAAVKSLGVFDRSKEPIEPLSHALMDSKKQVVDSAAEALRYFHKHEQLVVRQMIDVLGKLEDKRQFREHRHKIHQTLQQITKQSSIKNSYRAWTAWYRMNYNQDQ